MTFFRAGKRCAQCSTPYAYNSKAKKSIITKQPSQSLRSLQSLLSRALFCFPQQIEVGLVVDIQVGDTMDILVYKQQVYSGHNITSPVFLYLGVIVLVVSLFF